MMVSYGGYMFAVALHLQTGLGYSPLLAGLSFVPNAVCLRRDRADPGTGCRPAGSGR